MGKNQQLIKLFVVLFFSTAFIFSFSHYGAKAFEKITNADGKFSDGTAIGALDVSGKTDIEVKSLLEEKYVDWLKDTTIEFQYGAKIAPFDLNQFHLDTKQTIASIEDGQKNNAFITIDKATVEKQVEILFPQIKNSDIDFEKLLKSLNETASLFEAGSHSYNLFNDYLLAENIKKDAIINEATVEMKSVPLDLQTIIAKKSTIDLPAESTFSLLEFAKAQKIENAEVLNVMATGIYQAILPSNFSIGERNIGSTLPDYAKLGFEAKVNKNNKADLVIANPNKAKYFLELKLDHNQLKVTLKGEKFLYNYKISTKDEQKLKPKTIIQYSPLLLGGKTKVQTQGAEGLIIKVTRDVYEGESFIKSEVISEDYYPPVYQVELHGLAGQSSGTSVNQAGTTTSNQPTNNSTENSNQTTQSTSVTGQQDANDSDLWGKPNEQPK